MTDEPCSCPPGQPGCAVPDCEYLACAGSDLCWCHSQGFNPPLTYGQYEALPLSKRPAYREKIRKLAAEAAARRAAPAYQCSVCGAITRFSLGTLAKQIVICCAVCQTDTPHTRQHGAGN